MKWFFSATALRGICKNNGISRGVFSHGVKLATDQRGNVGVPSWGSLPEGGVKGVECSVCWVAAEGRDPGSPIAQLQKLALGMLNTTYLIVEVGKRGWEAPFTYSWPHLDA